MSNSPDITNGTGWVWCNICNDEHLLLYGWDNVLGRPCGYYYCETITYPLQREDVVRVEVNEDED